MNHRRRQIWKWAGVFICLLAAAGLWFLNVHLQGRSGTFVVPGFFELRKIPGSSPPRFLALCSTGETRRGDPQLSVAFLEIRPGEPPVFRRQPLGTSYPGNTGDLPLATVSKSGEALVLQYEVVANYLNGQPFPENSLLDATETELEFTLSKATPKGRLEEIRRWRRRGPVDTMPDQYVPFDGEFYGLCDCSKVVWRIDANGKESSFPSNGFSELEIAGIPGLFFDESGNNSPTPATGSGNAEGAKVPNFWQFGMLNPGKDGIVPVPGLPRLYFPEEVSNFCFRNFIQIGGRQAVVLNYRVHHLFLVFPEADGTFKEWRPLTPILPGTETNDDTIQFLPEARTLVFSIDCRRDNPPRLLLRRLDTESGRWYKTEVNPANCPVFRDFPNKAASKWRDQTLRLIQKTGSLKLESWFGKRLPFDNHALAFRGVADVFAPDLLLLKFWYFEDEGGDQFQTILRVQPVVWEEDGNIFDIPPVPAPNREESLKP